MGKYASGIALLNSQVTTMPIINSADSCYYEYRFITTFEETNVVGNIYFANFALWQGKCREMFLYEYCPGIIDEIKSGLALITLDLSIQYVSQLFAFDKVVIRMSLDAQSVSRLLMGFKYYKEEENGSLTIVATGTQATLAARMINGTIKAVPYPDAMIEVIEEYGMAR